jgi:hypothetical protein
MKNTLKKVAVLSALLVLGALLVLAVFYREPKPPALSRKAHERIEALDDALRNGLISRTDHDRRVAQIQSDDAPSPDAGESDDDDEAPPAPSAPAPASSH